MSPYRRQGGPLRRGRTTLRRDLDSAARLLPQERPYPVEDEVLAPLHG
ncbi:hypothetical protein [Streptomyces sp. BK205]|nr:hypothetical protein [Streptomyces sp. BK205]